MALNTCPDCGSQVSSEATNCPNCGKPFTHNTEAPNFSQEPSNELPPKTWLVESILATLFCCLPFGIVGIINAAKVESNWYAGRKEIALKASRDAKKWTMIALYCGIAVGVLYILYFVVLGAAFYSSSL
ncbi:CD225/dispanin family protein [Bacteroides sedimenti]|uniref:Putative zinc-ribbon domain-containing protein n=1 Tax=Bacteroides sedimenti TaxID=2136147 RepID=A0ABM8IA37_9BACE